MQKLQTLVVRAKTGDKDAFGQLYREYFLKIYRFIYSSIRNRELSEDLTQNTFLKCWRSFSTYSSARASFQTYLFAIARNLLIDWFRKKKEVSLEAIAEQPSRESVEDEAVKHEEKIIVWSALFRLKELDRQLVILRYFEELSFADIAMIVGKREGAVRVHTHRILKELKKELEKDV